MTSSGPMRKLPALRSSSEPNTLGESKRGMHNHSTLPVGAMSAAVSQSERKPRSAIGGNGDAPRMGPPRFEPVTPTFSQRLPGNVSEREGSDRGRHRRLRDGDQSRARGHPARKGI